MLKGYCSWLIGRIFYEQANCISNSGEVSDSNLIYWINQAILKYKNTNVSFNHNLKINNGEDYLKIYNNYIDYLDRYENGLFGV